MISVKFYHDAGRKEGEITITAPGLPHQVIGFFSFRVSIRLSYEWTPAAQKVWDARSRLLQVTDTLRGKISNQWRKFISYMTSVITEETSVLEEILKNWAEERKLPFTVNITEMEFAPTSRMDVDDLFGEFSVRKTFKWKFVAYFVPPKEGEEREENPQSLLYAIQFLEHYKIEDEKLEKGTLREQIKEQFVDAIILPKGTEWLNAEIGPIVTAALASDEIRDLVKVENFQVAFKLDSRYLEGLSPSHEWRFYFTLPIGMFEQAKKTYHEKGIRALLNFLVTYLSINPTIMADFQIPHFYSFYNEASEAFERGILDDKRPSETEKEETL